MARPLDGRHQLKARATRCPAGCAHEVWAHAGNHEASHGKSWTKKLKMRFAALIRGESSGFVGVFAKIA
jgi:hypothetical protein